MTDDPFSSLYGEGDYRAFILALPLKSDAVRAMLPDGLELELQSATTDGTPGLLHLWPPHARPLSPQPLAGAAKGIDQAPLGAFRLVTHWRLAAPKACK